MSIGKYLTNMAVIGALAGAFGTLKQTRQMPNDWRRVIIWVVWAAGLVLAIAGVAKRSDDEDYENEIREQEAAAKAAARAAKRNRA